MKKLSVMTKVLTFVSLTTAIIKQSKYGTNSKESINTENSDKE